MKAVMADTDDLIQDSGLSEGVVRQYAAPAPPSSAASNAGGDVQCIPCAGSVSVKSSCAPSTKGSPESEKIVTFKCGLCWKEANIALRVPGHQWERECKRAYDGLARLSEKQKEQEWWSETKSKPKQLRMAILDYMKNNPSGVGRGKT